MSDLIHRLRCRYPLGPITDGEPECGWRDMSGPVPSAARLPLPIMLEAAAEIDRLTRERDEARAEVKSLRAENHNLNWALGTEGYEQMATPEEQAEHEEAVRRTDEVLDRMAAAKAEHDAKYRDAERYRWLRQMIYDDRIIVAADRMLHGEALDSAIDAALAQIEQERSEQAKDAEAR